MTSLFIEIMIGIVTPIMVAIIGGAGVFYSVKGKAQAEAGKAQAEANGEAIKEVHILVNSRLDAALRKITALEERVGLVTGERDEARGERDEERAVTGAVAAAATATAKALTLIDEAKPAT